MDPFKPLQQLATQRGCTLAQISSAILKQQLSAIDFIKTAKADEGLVSLANQCGITLKEMSSQVIQLGPVATVVVIGNVAEPPLPLPIPDYLFNDDANNDASGSGSTNTTGKKQSANKASTSNKLPVNSNVQSIHRRCQSRRGVAAPPGFAYNARDVLYNLSTHKACSKNRGFIEPLSQWTQKPDGTLYATCDRHR